MPNISNDAEAVPAFAKLLQITLHYETRKLDTSNKMRTPEHINIYIIVRMIFVSCANRPTTLFILINSSLEVGQSCAMGPWGLPPQLKPFPSFFPENKMVCQERTPERSREGRRYPQPPVGPRAARRWETEGLEVGRATQGVEAGVAAAGSTS